MDGCTAGGRYFLTFSEFFNYPTMSSETSMGPPEAYVLERSER